MIDYAEASARNFPNEICMKLRILRDTNFRHFVFPYLNIYPRHLRVLTPRVTIAHVHARHRDGSDVCFTIVRRFSVAIWRRVLDFLKGACLADSRGRRTRVSRVVAVRVYIARLWIWIKRRRKCVQKPTTDPFPSEFID